MYKYILILMIFAGCGSIVTPEITPDLQENGVYVLENPRTVKEQTITIEDGKILIYTDRDSLKYYTYGVYVYENDSIKAQFSVEMESGTENRTRDVSFTFNYLLKERKLIKTNQITGSQTWIRL